MAAAQFARVSAELDLARTVVRAPFDARVSRVDVETHQFLAVGASIGALDGTAAAEIDVQVPQDRMAAMVGLAAGGAAAATSNMGHAVRPSPAVFQPIAAGRSDRPGAEDPHRLSATVSPTTGDGVLAGPATVARISDSVDAETRSLGVIVRVAEPYAQTGSAHRSPLIKGMFVRVDLAASPVSGAVLVPRSAVRNGRVMLVGPNNRLDFAKVTPVFSTDGIAVLAPGTLPVGARVVTSDPSPAIEGLLLAPQPDRVAEARLEAAAERTLR
ncbi:MAG: HlyD family efflux transporter periplasmic adaptor subunit [Pseudomonadota bacterium]